jgi:hypothetical protein
MELNLHPPIKFYNYLNVFGFVDVSGFHTVTDEFGITFQSFFIACDFQDLWAAAVYFQQVKIV